MVTAWHLINPNRPTGERHSSHIIHNALSSRSSASDRIPVVQTMVNKWKRTLCTCLTLASGWALVCLSDPRTLPERLIRSGLLCGPVHRSTCINLNGADNIPDSSLCSHCAAEGSAKPPAAPEPKLEAESGFFGTDFCNYCSAVRPRLGQDHF
jgi:hypothetical protein